MIVSVNLPENVSSVDKDLFESHCHYIAEELKILNLHDVLVTYHGLSFYNDIVIPESIHRFPAEKKQETELSIYSEYSRLTKNWLDTIELPPAETYLQIHHPWSINYWHWMSEAILRIWLVRKQSHHMILLLPESFRHVHFVNESIKPFRFKRIYFIPENKCVRAKNLCMPQLKPSMDSYYTAHLNGIRAHYLNYALNERNVNIDLGQRIYISRATATRRRVVNEDQVIEVMRRFNFSIVENERLAFFEQVSAYRHARYLVSIHGSGLSNMMFMESGVGILEMHKQRTNPGDWHSFAFWNMSNALGLKYYHQVCQPTDQSAHFFDADFLIDVDLLENNLRLMVGATNHG